MAAGRSRRGRRGPRCFPGGGGRRASTPPPPPGDELSPPPHLLFKITSPPPPPPPPALSPPPPPPAPSPPPPFPKHKTNDEAILVADRNLDSRGLYVGLTRGRHANRCYVITAGDGRTGNDILEGAIRRDWADEPATRTQRDLNLDHALDRALDSANQLDRYGRNTRLEAGIEAAINNSFNYPQHGRSVDDDFGIEL